MSNATRKFKKEQGKIKNTYTVLVDTPYGSLYQSLSMFIPRLRKGTFAFINYMNKLTFPYIDDKDFMKKMLNIYGVTKEEVEDIPLICFKSKWNMLFHPFITDVNTGEITILPVRPDGSFASTCDHRITEEFVDWNAIFNEIEGEVLEVKDDETISG